uniref:SERPIN domain-containing protein n=1 Tax=Haemonchus contortus TaxID=6289 RepID=A0A7I4YT18_HAECO|nr:Protease inhibitor I4 domain containing protein [Haemonchus contortus]
MFPIVETDFGLDMLRHAPANESVVVSPISVIFALAMVQAGARGTTKSQINSVISKGESDSEIEEHYSELSRQIMNATSDVKSRIANGFFLNNQFQIEKDYEQTIKEKFDAEVKPLDFEKTADAVEVINGFISKQTEGKISDMVDEQMVKDAFSIIVNAIYFTAEWDYKFDKLANTKGTFYSAGGRRKVEYMNDFAVHRMYAENGEFQVLSLQYLDTSFSFNIFLPKKRSNPDEGRSKLTGEQIQNLLSKLEMTYISITIPKMKIETDFKLKEALIAMGVSEMFTDSADLTGITKEPPLQVSDAAHKAIIEVDEAGTTAAAATVIGMVGASAVMEEPVTFQADHPFLFILTKENNPLFMGRYV